MTPSPSTRPETRALEGVVVDPVATLPALLEAAKTPVRFHPGVAVDTNVRAALGKELDVAEEFARRSIAENTLRNYANSWKQFVAWCEERQLCPLPAAPEVVAAYITTVAVSLDQDGEPMLAEDGTVERGRLRPQSVGLHLQAINKAHVAVGLAKPGTDPHVAAVYAGIRRTFKVRRERAKAALDLPLLLRLLVEVRRPSPHAARDRALVLLAQHTDAGAGVLARLDWTRVELTSRVAEVRLPSPRKGTNGEVTMVLAAAPDPAVCPVEALRVLGRSFGRSGPVLPALDGDGRSTGLPLTKGGITKALRRLTSAAGFTPPPSGIPALTQDQLREVVAQIASPSTTQLRDEAVLCTGWTGALRRSNVSALLWRDVELHPEGIRVILAWSKTDQDGAEQHEVWLPPADEPGDFDPHRAFLAWRDHIADTIGGDPTRMVPDQPVFTPVDRHGNIGRIRSGRLARFSGDAINEMVQHYCEAAGLDPTRFGAHSLRIGFVTEALKNGDLTVSEVQQVTGHKSLEVLMRYNRAQQNRDNNPARKLLSRRAGRS